MDEEGVKKKRKYVPVPPKEHQFKKGVSANPGGVPKHPVLKALKNLTIKEFSEVIEAALTSDVGALKSYTESQTASAVQVGVARALFKAVNDGDWQIIEQIAARIVGKLPDKLEVTSNNHTSVILEHARIIEANKKLENDF